MVRKLNLLAAILAGFMTAEVSAGGMLDGAIPESVGLKSQEALLEQTQSGSVDLKEIEPLYLVEKLDAEEMYQEILSYLSAKETLRLSLSSKGMLAGVKQSTGLYFSNMSFEGYLPWFKNLVIKPRPHMDRKFIPALLSCFKGDNQREAFAQSLMNDKASEISQSHNNRFCLLPEFLSRYSQDGIRNFYTNLLQSSNPDIDLLVKMFKSNLPIVQAINEDFLESVSVQSFKEQLMPYVQFYAQIVTQQNKTYYICQPNQSDEMRAFGFLMLAQDERVGSDDRLRAVGLLAYFGDEYKDKAAQICLSITQDESVGSYDRLKAVEILTTFGKEYKDKAAQACLFIVQDKSMTFFRRKALEILATFGKEYKNKAAQACLFIAQDVSVDSYCRVEAAEDLAKFGEGYKDTAAQVCLSIAQDVSVNSDYRVEAARVLSNFGEEYKDMAAQICLSIAQDVSLNSYYRAEAAELLANKFGIVIDI